MILTEQQTGLITKMILDNIDIIKLAFILLVLDGIFIYNYGNKFNDQIVQVQKEDMKIRYLGVILAYIFLVFSLYWFIIKEDKGPLNAFLLGISIYGTYEYTNYSLLKDWDFGITLLDTIWGGILFASTTFLYKMI